jgi:radical SAM-linked protein
MIREVTRTKNKGFTIAPEAGTERLRRVINKPIDEKEMEATASRVFEAGSKGIKLYFMLGLPSETLEDMDGIVSMAEKVLAVARRYGRGGRDITVSVSTFVPKAHTPFQWEGQIPIEEVKARGVYLRNRLKPLKVQFKQHSPETSFLEAVFSRGDRRLAAAIESAWRKGRRFDSWEEHQDLACWMETFRGEGIDPMFYANRMVPLDACLPWEHLDTLATKDFLVLDYKRSVKERVIPDCRYGRCYNCGVCNMEAIRGREDGLRPIAYRPEDLPPERLSALGTVSGDVRRIRGLSASGRLERTTLRLQHTKLDRMRWLSQVELVTLFQRALRRAGIPVAYSEGFSPHAKLSFGPALPVGTEGLAEYLDMELSGVVASSEIGEIEKRLNRELPEGIVVTRIGELPPGVPSLNRTITGFAYEVWVEGGIRIEMDGVAAGGLEGGDAAVPLSDTICVKRKVTKDAQRGAPGRVVEKEIDIRPLIEEIRWVSPNRISLFLTSDEGRGCRPVEVLSGVFGPDASRIPWRVLRTGCYQKAAGHWVPILSEVYHPCVHS